MATIKCINCGTEVSVDKNEHTAICKICGSKITVHESTTENSKSDNKVIPQFTDEAYASKNENSISPSVDALIVRGYFFLSEGEFDQAYEKFDKALECDSKLHKAYWGILLAEHQCKNETELIQQGVCLDTDPNYNYACKYSDVETTTKQYECTAKLSMYVSHVLIINMIYNKMYRPARLRAGNYASSKYSDQRLCKIHQIFLKEDTFSTFSRSVTNALLLLLKIYKEDDLFSSIDKTVGLSSKIANSYTFYMNRLKDTIISGSTKLKELFQLAEIWANPCENENSEFVGLDDCPSSVGERWLYLAEQLIKDPVFIGNSSFSEIIFKIYDNAAAASADVLKCTTERKIFYNLVLSESNNLETVEYLISKDPDCWQAYWRGIELIQQMDSPDDFIIDDHDVKAFLKTTFSNYKQEKGESILESKRKMIQLLEDYKDKKRTQTEKYINGAVVCTSANSEELHEKWNTYIADVDKRCEEKIHTLDQHMSMVNEFMAKHDRQAAIKGIISSVFSIMILAIPVFAAFFAWQHIRFPERLMPYSTLWYTVATATTCFVGGIVLTSFQNCLKKITKYKRNRIKLTKTVSSLCWALTFAISTVAVGLFIVAGVHFNSAIGTIRISKPEEMEYLNMHPKAKFVLTEDIDLRETDWKAISPLFGFSGTLDGQGHSVSNAISDKPYFIKKNSGTIKNIHFINSGTTDNEFCLVNDNKGTLSGITINWVIFDSIKQTNEQTLSNENVSMTEVDMFSSEYSFNGIAYENSGNIIDCDIININGSYNSFCGLVRENESKGRIIACKVKEIDITARSAVGVVSTNYGIIRNSSFSGNLNALFSAYGLLKEGGKDSIVENCFTCGNLTSFANVAGFAYRVSGLIQNCYSQVNITLRYDVGKYYDLGLTRHDVNYIKLSGFVCELYPSPTVVESVLINNCYYYGTITFDKNAYYRRFYEFSGLVGGSNVYTSSDVEMTAIVSNSFCNAVYSFEDEQVERAELESNFVTKIQNTYGNSNYDLDSTLRLEGELFKIPPSEMLTENFIYNTLKWDPEVWSMSDGSLPTLKMSE